MTICNINDLTQIFFTKGWGANWMIYPNYNREQKDLNFCKKFLKFRFFVTNIFFQRAKTYKVAFLNEFYRILFCCPYANLQSDIKSSTPCPTGVKLINNLGVSLATWSTINANGWTTNEVPIIIKRSHFGKS